MVMSNVSHRMSWPTFIVDSFLEREDKTTVMSPEYHDWPKFASCFFRRLRGRIHLFIPSSFLFTFTWPLPPAAPLYRLTWMSWRFSLRLARTQRDELHSFGSGTWRFTYSMLTFGTLLRRNCQTPLPLTGHPKIAMPSLLFTTVVTPLMEDQRPNKSL